MLTKKLFYIAASSYVCTSLTAQLNFSSSANNIPANFPVQAMCTASASDVYAVGGNTLEIYKSTDGGLNWNSQPYTGISSGQIISGALCYTGSKLIVATQDNTFANAGVFSSADGATWTVSNNGISANFRANDLTAASSTDIYAVGGIYTAGSGWSRKIYKSTDGGATWSDLVFSGIGPNHNALNSICHTGTKFLLSTQDMTSLNNGIFAG